MGEDHPGELIENSKIFSQQEKDRMLYLNAVEFLGLKEWAPLQNAQMTQQKKFDQLQDELEKVQDKLQDAKI